MVSAFLTDMQLGTWKLGAGLDPKSVLTDNEKRIATMLRTLPMDTLSAVFLSKNVFSWKDLASYDSHARTQAFARLRNDFQVMQRLGLGQCVDLQSETCAFEKRPYHELSTEARRTLVRCCSFLNAPNYGSRVPVDTAPGPVPVYRAPKNLPLIPAVKTDSWNLSLRQHSDIHQRR